MDTIHKYPLAITGDQTLQLPEGAEILTVQEQRGTACLWALVNTERPTTARHIEIFGTGHPVRRDMGVSRRYIATFQLAELGLVFHAFEYTGI